LPKYHLDSFYFSSYFSNFHYYVSCNTLMEQCTLKMEKSKTKYFVLYQLHTFCFQFQTNNSIISVLQIFLIFSFFSPQNLTWINLGFYYNMSRGFKVFVFLGFNNMFIKKITYSVYKVMK